MFAFGKKNKGESGSILLLVIVVLVVASVYTSVEINKFSAILKLQKSAEITHVRRSWAKAMSNRIDCKRMLDPYTKTTKCPAQTSRTLVLRGEQASEATGPEQSFHLGGDWYAQVSCGSSDIQMKVARYNKGAFAKDPLTGQRLDFNHPSSLVSDGGENIRLCPGYFSGVDPDVRMLGMSIATLQYQCASIAGPHKTVQWLPESCDGSLGMIAELDDRPPKEIYRKGGASATAPYELDTVPKNVYTVYSNIMASWGLITKDDSGQQIEGDMRPDWTYSAQVGATSAAACCNKACRKRGYPSGVSTKCDNTVSRSQLGTTTWDEPAANEQVNCLCIR